MPDRSSKLHDYNCMGTVSFFLLKQSRLNIVCKCASWYIREKKQLFSRTINKTYSRVTFFKKNLKYSFMFRSINFKPTFGVPGKKTDKNF